MGWSVSKRAAVAFVAGCLVLGPAAGASFLDVLQTICDPGFPGCTGGVNGLAGVRSLALSPDGKHLYTCGSLDDALVVFSRNSTTGKLTHVQTIREGDPGIDGLDSCRGVAISPDGKHVYTAALLDSALGAWSRNTTTGALTLVEFERDDMGGVSGLGGASAVVVSPGFGLHVYVVGRSDDAVVVFLRDPPSGLLYYEQTLFDGVGGVDGLDAAEAIAISPDGKHVYVAGETDDAVAVFERETDPIAFDFGELTFVQAVFDDVAGVDGLNGAGNVALDFEGKNLYVASERTNDGGDWLAVFSRNAATGALTFLQGFDESDFNIYQGCSGVGPENSGVSVSPNGLFVFATNPYRGTIAAFRRSATGTLTFIESICDRNSGLDGLVGANFLLSSADGKHTYWTAGSAEHLGVLDTRCSVPNVDLMLTGQSVSTTQVRRACRSIIASDYTVLEAGNVTFEAPEILLGDLFEVEGEFKAVQTVP